MASGDRTQFHCKKCGRPVSKYSYFHRKNPCNRCNELEAMSIKGITHSKSLTEMFPDRPNLWSSIRRKRN